MLHRHPTIRLQLVVIICLAVQAYWPILPEPVAPVAQAAAAAFSQAPAATPEASTTVQAAAPADLPSVNATVSFTATLTATRPVTPTVTAPDLNLGLKPDVDLSLSLDPPWAAPGDVVTYTVVATNPAAAGLPALVVTDTLPAGLVYVAQSAVGFAYDPRRQELTWPAGDLHAGAVITGSFQVRVQGLALGETITDTVTATSPALATAVPASAALEVVSPRNNETWVTPEAGGQLRSADDRLLLRVPPGAVAARTQIVYRPVTANVPRPSKIERPFELTARDEDGQAVTTFGAGVQVRLAYGAPRPAEPGYYREPALYYYDPGAQQWQPVAAAYSAQTGQLTAALTHFSIYSEGSANYMVERMSALRGAQTDLFTRSIGYGTSFELVPGRGGLTPVLGLRYSSSNHTPNSGHHSFAGFGWQLTGADAIYIAPGDANAFKPALSLQGTTYSLRRIDYGGQVSAWFAKEDPFLQIQNPSDELWYIWTPDGTKYTFSAPSGGFEYYWKFCDTASPSKRIVRLPLTNITDVLGNSVNYTWEAEEEHSPYPCDNHQRGARLKTISYNGGTTQVVLDYTERLDRPAGYDNADNWLFFTSKKLRYVTVQVKADGTGAWRTVRRYELGHNPQTETPAVSQKALHLEWLEEQTTGTAAWPRTTFGYNATWFSAEDSFGAMSWLRNGYGAEVAFTAVTRLAGQPLIVTQRVEKELITAALPVTWTYTSTVWFEGGTSNGETLASGYGEVGVTDPGGGLTRRLFHLTDDVSGGKSDALAGREDQIIFESAGQTVQKTLTQWVADTANLPIANVHPAAPAALLPRFVYSSSVEQYEGAQRVSRQENYYQPSRQGTSGLQYGNLTEQRLYEGTASGWRATPLRTTYSWYYPNTTAWIVNKVAQTQVYKSCSGCAGAELETTSQYIYDSPTNAVETPPTQGLLRVRQDGLAALPTAQYEYWANGNLKRQLDGNNNATLTLYDSAFQVYPLCVKNALGHSTRTRYYGVPALSAADVGAGADQCPAAVAAGDTAWDSAGAPMTGRAFGQPQSVTDVNGVTTTLAYDSWGRFASETVPSDTGPTRASAYRPFSSPPQPDQPFWVDQQQRDGSAGDGYQHTVTYYDGFGRVIQAKSEFDATQHGEVSTAYTWFDGVARAGVPTAVTGALSASVPAWDKTGWLAVRDGTAPTTATSYDVRQRVIQVMAPDGGLTRQYYAVGVDATEGAVRRKQATLDANNHQTIRETDALGRLRASKQYLGEYVTAPDWQASAYASAADTYNARDLLVAVTDPGNATTSIGYDSLGRKTSLSDPDLGAWSYAYDAAGNLTRQTDAKSQTTCFYYDGLNRLKGKTYRSDTNCPTPDPGSYAVTYGYDSTAGSNSGIGRRTSLTNAASSVSWVYDVRGRVTSEKRSVYGIGGGTFITQWAYDAADRVTSVTYPDTEVVTTTYTFQGLPNGLSGTQGAYVTSTTYDVSGRLDLRTFGNGLRTDYDYFPWTTLNGQGRLKRISTGTVASPQAVQDIRYYQSATGALGYDAGGNVLRSEDWQTGAPQTQVFGYDPLNRLTSASATGGASGSGDYAQVYTYTANGNLTLKNQATEPEWQYGAQVTGCPAGTLTKPHALSQAFGSFPGTYTYDCNGNTTIRVEGSTTYAQTWDAENRLQSATVNGGSPASFAYDGDGGRSKATFGSGDSATITAYAGNLYEQTTRYQETFDDGLAQGWTAASGAWAVSGGGYRQSAATNNTNAYRNTAQSGPLYTRWVATYTSGTSAGLYLFASAGTGTERGNSYRIWQDASYVYIYRATNNSAGNWKVRFAAANAAGQTHSYGVFYDPATGKLQVWRDGVLLGSWTDPTPLTTGAYLSLRTDGSNVLFDDVAVSDVVKYYYLGGARVAVRKAGAVSYLHGDHLSSTAVATDSAGAVVANSRVQYYPFGATRSGGTGLPTEYRYTGQRREPNLGLYDYGARFYEPRTGRFLAPDTLVPAPGDPQALNRYSYSNNNPLRYVDPSGHESCEPGDNACWESRWYRAHGYELGDHGWRYSGQYYFGDADAFAEFLADVANGDHGVAVGSSFHANVGPVTLSLQPAGQDTELSNVLGIVGVGMDVADFGITASFAALYTVDLVSSISSGPGFAAGLAAGQVGYMSIQGPLAVIDGIGLGAVFFADVSAGRTQVGPDQVAVGGDMLVSLWSITVSNLSPVVFPGTYLGLTGDSCQLAYDFVRATGRLPGYSLIVNWGATR